MLGTFLSSGELWMSLGTGLLTGFFTGYFFQRLQLKVAAEDNTRLQAELNALRTALYSRVGVVSAGPLVADGKSANSGLREVVLAKATSIQDGRGRVDRHALRSHFVSEGFSAQELDAALESLVKGGDVRKDGHWLILP